MQTINQEEFIEKLSTKLGIVLGKMGVEQVQLIARVNTNKHKLDLSVLLSTPVLIGSPAIFCAQIDTEIASLIYQLKEQERLPTDFCIPPSKYSERGVLEIDIPWLRLEPESKNNQQTRLSGSGSTTDLFFVALGDLTEKPKPLKGVYFHGQLLLDIIFEKKQGRCSPDLVGIPKSLIVEPELDFVLLEGIHQLTVYGNKALAFIWHNALGQRGLVVAQQDLVGMAEAKAKFDQRALML